MKQLITEKPKAAFVASVYRHLSAFHIPYMKWFQQQGFEVHAYGQPDHGKEELEKLNIVCHDISLQRSPFHLDNFQAFKQITQSFEKEQFQAVHVHTPVASVLGRLAAKKTGVPAVFYTAHGFHFFKGAPLKNWLTFYPVERLMAKYTDYLITINEEDFKRAQDFPVRKEVHFVKGVGVDRKQYKTGLMSEEKRRQKREQLGIKPESFVILCVAELIERKNQGQLIEAMQQLKKYGPVTCLLVGNGEAEAQFQLQAEKLGLQEEIQFLGYRKDVPELIDISDVATLLSKQEGLPRALMEALAAGKPIVTTDVRGNNDLVRHGENGFVVPLGHIGKTVEAFEWLMNNRDQLNQMGQVSQRISAEYDLAVIEKDMGLLYEKAIQTIIPVSGQEVVS